MPLPAWTLPDPSTFQTAEQLPGHLEDRGGLPIVLALGDLARARYDGRDGLWSDTHAFEKRQQFQQDQVGGKPHAVADIVEASVGHLESFRYKRPTQPRDRS
jgi:hypothetical protein